MPRYALVINGQFSRLDDKQNQPPNIAHKNVVWLPCPHVPPTPFDPKTQKRLGPTYTVNPSEVTETWSVASLSTEELSGAKAAAIASINGAYRPIMKALLDHENRLRAKDAPPKSALTIAEYETYFQGLL